MESRIKKFTPHCVCRPKTATELVLGPTPTILVSISEDAARVDQMTLEHQTSDGNWEVCTADKMQIIKIKARPSQIPTLPLPPLFLINGLQAKSGFEMCFDIGSQHLGCWGQNTFRSWNKEVCATLCLQAGEKVPTLKLTLLNKKGSPAFGAKLLGDKLPSFTLKHEAKARLKISKKHGVDMNAAGEDHKGTVYQFSDQQELENSGSYKGEVLYEDRLAHPKIRLQIPVVVRRPGTLKILHRAPFFSKWRNIWIWECVLISDPGTFGCWAKTRLHTPKAVSYHGQYHTL